MAHRFAQLFVAGVTIILLVLAAVGAAQEATPGTPSREEATMKTGDANLTCTGPILTPGVHGTAPTCTNTAADRDWSTTCDDPTAARSATIVLGEAGVAAPCVVVSAGDLVTWLNPTTTPVTIQTADDQFATEDASATFKTIELPAQEQVTVRVLHAGRIDYTAPGRPEISGTILVLGRGAA